MEVVRVWNRLTCPVIISLISGSRAATSRSSGSKVIVVTFLLFCFKTPASGHKLIELRFNDGQLRGQLRGIKLQQQIPCLHEIAFVDEDFCNGSPGLMIDNLAVAIHFETGCRNDCAGNIRCHRPDAKAAHQNDERCDSDKDRLIGDPCFLLASCRAPVLSFCGDPDLANLFRVLPHDLFFWSETQHKSRYRARGACHTPGSLQAGVP